MPSLAGIDPDGRREVRTVTDACSSPAWTYGSEDQDHEQGAILGARSHNQARTTADAHGIQTAVLGAKADPPDHFRRLVGTYGSEGLGFESKRERRAELPGQVVHSDVGAVGTSYSAATSRSINWSSTSRQGLRVGNGIRWLKERGPMRLVTPESTRAAPLVSPVRRARDRARHRPRGSPR